MYLRKLTIENLKRIGHLELPFDEAEGRTRMWTVLIGENGTAKTSILQAIAMSAAGPLRVNELAGRLTPHLLTLRGQGKAMAVNAEYSFTPLGLPKEFHPMVGDLREDDRLLSSIHLDRGSSTLMGTSGYSKEKRRPLVQRGVSGGSLTPLDRARAENTAHWFVAGYGVARDLPETGLLPDLSRASVDRLRSLFERRSALVSTAFIDVLGANNQYGSHFTKTLRKVFVGTGILPEDVVDLKVHGQRFAKSAKGLLLRNNFVQLMGADNVKIPLSAVAHGMQSTIAWISDLVGHIILETSQLKENIDSDVMEGVVLVDEIDLYLHPEWQVRLVTALRKVFPRMQFIVTTHSPAMLAAFQPEEIVRLKVDDRDGYVKRYAPMPETGRWKPVEEGGVPAMQPDPRIMTTSAIYQRYFGLTDIYGAPEGTKLAEFQSIASNPYRTDAEDRRMQTLALELRAADIDPVIQPAARVRA